MPHSAMSNHRGSIRYNFIWENVMAHQPAKCLEICHASFIIHNIPENRKKTGKKKHIPEKNGIQKKIEDFLLGGLKFSRSSSKKVPEKN